MHIRLRILGGTLGMTLAIAAIGLPAVAAAAEPAAVSTQATTTVAATCNDGHWPASVQGRPLLFHVHAPAGDYIWHDSTGWHFRVTHASSSRVVFTGRIVSSAPLDAVPVRLEKNDVVTLSADKMTLTYRLVNYGGIDGFNFRASCANQLTFVGRMGGVKLSPMRIRIGRLDRHPLENPFVLRRVS
jgi:hypothetical protein